MIDSSGMRVDLEGSPAPSNGVVDVEHPQDLVRVLSTLQFIFCQPPLKQGEIDLGIFGDGWSWVRL